MKTWNPIYHRLIAVSAALVAFGCQGTDFAEESRPLNQVETQSEDDQTPAVEEEVQTEESITTGKTVLDEPPAAPAETKPAREIQEFMITESKKPVDIFFVMDTSGSMNEEKADLEANMKGFMKSLDTAMIDAKVTAVGSTSFNFPADISADKFRVVNQTVGSNNAVGVLNRVFTGTLPLPLRDNAGLEVIFITDDDGRGAGNLAADFKSPKKATVTGIVGLKTGQDAVNANCNIVRIGQEYMTLAKSSGGSIFDLCAKDWSAMLKQLSDKIKVRNRGFKLQNKPKASTKMVVKLDTRELGAAEFSYDGAQNAIVLADNLEVQVGMKVIVEFEKE